MWHDNVGCQPGRVALLEQSITHDPLFIAKADRCFLFNMREILVRAESTNDT